MVKLTAILNWNGFHNLPKKYIQRRMFKGVVYENSHYITPTVVYNYTRDWIFDENAPWTSEAIMRNDPARRRKSDEKYKLIPPLLEWFYYRGDKVINFMFYLAIRKKKKEILNKKKEKKK